MTSVRSVSEKSLHVLVIGPVAISDLEKYLADVPSTYTDLIKSRNRAVPVSDLVSQLLNNGTQVTLITLSQNIEKKQVDILRGEKFELIVLPERRSVKWRAGTFWFSEIQNLRSYISKIEYDVIHAHWTYEYALAALSRDKKRTLITAHDAPWIIFWHTFDAYHLGKLILSILVGIYAKSIIFVSSYLSNSWSWIFRNKRYIIGNFTMLPRIANISSKKNSEIVICSIGDTSNHKNLICALLAWNSFSSSYPNSEYLVIGVTKLQALHKWPQHQKVIESSNVTWCGTLTRIELALTLSRAQVLLHSSLEESFCMAAAESLSLGIPVIGPASCQALASLTGKAGILVSELDPKNLSDALHDYFTNPNLQKQILFEASKKRSEITQNNANNIRAIYQIYLSIVGKD